MYRMQLITGKTLQQNRIVKNHRLTSKDWIYFTTYQATNAMKLLAIPLPKPPISTTEFATSCKAYAFCDDPNTIDELKTPISYRSWKQLIKVINTTWPFLDPIFLINTKISTDEVVAATHDTKNKEAKVTWYDVPLKPSDIIASTPTLQTKWSLELVIKIRNSVPNNWIFLWNCQLGSDSTQLYWNWVVLCARHFKH